MRYRFYRKENALSCADLYSVSPIVDVGKRVVRWALVVAVKSASHARSLRSIGVLLRRSLKTLRPRTGRRAVVGLITVRHRDSHSRYFELKKKPPAWGALFFVLYRGSLLVAAQAVRTQC